MSKRKRRKSHLQSIERRTKPGSAPGQVVVDPNSAQSHVHVMAYSPDKILDRRDDVDVEQLPRIIADHVVTWINVEGLSNSQLIEQLGQQFQLHRLALEDVVNVHQRAKVEEYGDSLFVVLRMVNLIDGRCGTEQVSFFIRDKVVLTFQEGHPGDPFDRVRERICDQTGRIRQSGADYLAYALIDAVIDAFYPVLETYTDRLDVLEDEVLGERRKATMDRLHEVKADLLTIRRAIWPQRDALNALMRDNVAPITPMTRLYLRDCYDHVVQIIELVETYRELTADLRDLYMSAISNRINETMRVLTVMSTIFIPLTFIAGVYGMNFDTKSSPWNMPELNWYFGYPLCLALMSVTTMLLFVYFYRQRWVFPNR